MTGAIECRGYGRDFTDDELALLRALIAGPPALNRHALSKEFCRRIGGLKDMMARVTMLAMHCGAVIALPPPTGGSTGRSRRGLYALLGIILRPPWFRWRFRLLRFSLSKCPGKFLRSRPLEARIGWKFGLVGHVRAPEERPLSAMRSLYLSRLSDSPNATTAIWASVSLSRRVCLPANSRT